MVGVRRQGLPLDREEPAAGIFLLHSLEPEQYRPALGAAQIFVAATGHLGAPLRSRC